MSPSHADFHVIIGMVPQSTSSLFIDHDLWIMYYYSRIWISCCNGSFKFRFRPHDFKSI